MTQLYKLLPKECVKAGTVFHENTFSFYENFLKDNNIKSELQLWQTKWRNEPEINMPNSAIESLEACNKDLFPNVHFLLNFASYYMLFRAIFFNYEEVKDVPQKLNKHGKIKWFGIDVGSSPYKCANRRSY